MQVGLAGLLIPSNPFGHPWSLLNGQGRIEQSILPEAEEQRPDSMAPRMPVYLMVGPQFVVIATPLLCPPVRLPDPY